jgi:hypothetical protein
MLLIFGHSWSDFDEIGISKKSIMFSYCYNPNVQTREGLEQQMKDAIFQFFERNREMYA